MNKSLIILIAAGSLLAGGVMAQDNSISPEVKKLIEEDARYRKLNPSQQSMYRIERAMREEDIRLFNRQQEQIHRITDTVNTSINTPQPLRVVPKFIPKPKYNGPKITPGLPSKLDSIKYYEYMQERARQAQEIYFSVPAPTVPVIPSAPYVPCGPGCIPSTPPSFLERMRQNALELQWKMFPSTRPKPCQTC